MLDRQITTAAGQMPLQYFEGRGDGPLIVVLMDAIGIREELREVAQWLQSLGYNVALPNLYYREGYIEDLDLNDPQDRDTIMRLYRGYSHSMAQEDIAALLEQVGGDPVGLLGYCMGGANALVLAGAMPDKIGAAAAIHPGGIATPAADSPHRLAPMSRGALYIAIADEDPYATEEQIHQLTTALDNANADYELELYPGAHHGFSFASLPSFNAKAQTKYQRAVEALFSRALR